MLILAVAAGLTVKQLMVPKSFGDVGHYRADALPMLANIYPPVHQGREACEECHPDVLEGYRKDVHRTVQCENCHGPADRHIAFMNGDLEGSTARRSRCRSRRNCAWVAIAASPRGRRRSRKSIRRSTTRCVR
ncbi:MAG: hypothetical protein M5R36_07615 [Deltaproteobacteria bacterium]|nr:hypothetical protein [Deltaproteobacteria bacterium]